MTFDEAMRYLTRESGWPRDDIKNAPSSAGWRIMEHVWDAVHTIERGER